MQTPNIAIAPRPISPHAVVPAAGPDEAEAESAARWADDGGRLWEPRSPRHVGHGKWRI
jgi:hypothetical protein